MNSNLDPNLKVDSSKLTTVAEELRAELAFKQRELNISVGFACNANSAKDLYKVFIEKYKQVPIKLRKGGRPSFSSDVVRKYDTPVTELVLKMKNLMAREKYLRIFEKHVDQGYIHYSWQMKSVTGRIYAEKPNVLSFPGELRKCIIPESDKVYIGFDIKNEELTIIAYLTECRGLIDDIKAGSDVFGELSAATGVARHDVKTAVYAYAYGSDSSRIASKIYEKEEIVDRVLALLYKKYPELSKWRKVPQQVEAAGHSTSIYGETYTIDKNSPDLNKEVRRAVNFIVQSSAASILKNFIKQFSESDVNGSIKVCVFDSVVIETERPEDVRHFVKEFFSKCLSGILQYDLKQGKSWYEVWASIK